jgi:hypothetical protein
MTDRIKGFTVILDRDYRDDDFEYIKNAVQMIKGVKLIEPYVSDGGDYIIETKAKSEIRDKIYDFIKHNL